MYMFENDQAALNEAEKFCKKLLNELVARLREKGMSSQVILVGSGARNLVMRNGKGPIDFDYNLNVQNYDDWPDGKLLKETVRNEFDAVLKANRLKCCRDSTSVLTTKPIYLKKLRFTVDLCIVRKPGAGSWFRLIHKKGSTAAQGKYFWNEMPHSSDVKEKADKIYQKGGWQKVRERYMDLKNHYLSIDGRKKKTQKTHPSFVCYVEAVNDVYNAMFLQKQK